MATPEKHPLIHLKPRNGRKFVLIIHGGAGTISRATSPPERQALYKTALRAALKAGYAVLHGGGEAMDAAVAAVTVLEGECSCELWLDSFVTFSLRLSPVQRGKGGRIQCFWQGVTCWSTYLNRPPTPLQNELESSIMLSKPPASHPNVPSTRRGFALTLLTRTRNPSQLAQAMYLSPEAVPHAMLSGHEAEAVGESMGIEPVDPSYFFTERRWKEHRRGLGLPDGPYPPGQTPGEGDPSESLDQMPTGTVGAVALDCRGCIASVTSTGGKTNKMVGRIGDTPQMGTGFWAEEWKEEHLFRKFLDKLHGRRQRRAIGVSGTGDGDVNPPSALIVPPS